jgi:integrase
MAWSYEDALRYLVARQLDIYVIQVLSQEEIEPEIVGDLRLVDLEGGGAPVPLSGHVSNARKGFLDGKDLERVIQELPEPVRPVVRFAALTGWRRGEILSRTWAHVDFERGIVRLEVE